MDLFNFYLKGKKEGGTLSKILNNYESQPQVCPDYSGKALGFGSCGTAFIVLVVGLILGLVLFILENVAKFLDYKTIENLTTPTFIAEDRRIVALRKVLAEKERQLEELKMAYFMKKFMKPSEKDALKSKY